MRSVAEKVGPPPPPSLRGDSIFDQARLKVYRARQHVYHLSAAWEYSVQMHRDYAERPDFQSPYGVNWSPLVVKIQLDIPLIIGDCIRNLRSSFDYIVSALAREADISDSQIIFPFNEERTKVADTFEDPPSETNTRAKAFQPLYRKYPDLKELILDRVRPYAKGDGTTDSGALIWRVVTADNVDKHRLMTPLVQRLRTDRIEIEDADGGDASLVGFTLLGKALDWQPGDQLKGEPDLAFDILFVEPGRLAGRPVVATLIQACEVAASTIEIFESHFFGD